MANKKPKIKYVNYGMGFTVQDGKKRWIELNKNLRKRKHKKLRKQILAHELLHFNSPNNHLDFWVDFKDMFNMRKNWEIFKFNIQNPKSVLGCLPIYFDYSDRKWSINWFLLLIMSAMILTIGGGVSLII